jgi:hypothetical protein
LLLSFKPTKIEITYLLTYFSGETSRRQLTVSSQRNRDAARKLVGTTNNRRDLIETTLQASESKSVYF